VPILVWNAQHGWVTFLHTQQSHAGMSAEDTFSWIAPLRFLGTQALVLLGFWFAAWVRAVWAHHPGREARPEIRYLWWTSVPLIAFFLVFSFRNGGGEPNWPIAGYISGLVLAVGWLSRELQAPRPIYRGLVAAAIGVTCTAGLLLTVAVHDTAPFTPVFEALSGPPTPENPSPLRRFDPTCRLRGWHALAVEVDRIRAELRSRGEEPVLAAGSWSLPGEIGFYCTGQPDVFSLGLPIGDRHSQYDLWHPNPIDEPGAFADRTFLVIGLGAEVLRPAFDHVEETRLVTHYERGQVLVAWPITIARGYRGFPRRTESPSY
jgi:hypothetical protein